MRQDASRDPSGFWAADAVVCRLIKYPSYLGPILMLIIALAAAANVAISKATGSSIPSVNDWIRHLMIPTVWLSLGNVAVNRGMISVDFLSSRFPNAVNRGIQAVAYLLGAAVTIFIGVQQWDGYLISWCGDDGQVRALNWRHVTRTHHGDCTVGSGRVIKKYKRGDAYCVDIFAYLLNCCRGHLSEVAVITVALPTRSPEGELAAQFGEQPLPAGFQQGARVRVSGTPEGVFPTGYPLAGAEGVVQYRFQWQAANFHPFGGYTSVRIVKHDRPLSMGDTLILPTEILERI